MNDVEPDERSGRLPGVAYPLIAAVLGGALVWSFSRILLAVGKDEAVLISSLLSVNILVGAALVAYGRRVRNRPVAFPFLLGAAAVVVAVGAVTAVAFGDRPPHEAEAAGGAKPERVTLTASGTKFLESTLTLTAGAKVSMAFDNKDAGLQHNFALFDGKDATAPALFHSPLVTGPSTATFTFTAPSKPGSYFFHCDVHPAQMTGTVTVQPAKPGGGGGGGGGPPSGALQLAAKGIAFSPTKLTATSTKVTIHFSNEDAGTPHNVAVFDGPDANAPPIFHGDLVTGPATSDYSFTLPGPGTFYFHCDVHPVQMTGTITLSG
jgi:plastocyanin